MIHKRFSPINVRRIHDETNDKAVKCYVNSPLLLSRCTSMFFGFQAFQFYLVLLFELNLIILYFQITIKGVNVSYFISQLLVCFIPRKHYKSQKLYEKDHLSRWSL